MRDTNLGSLILEINLQPEPMRYTLQTAGELGKKAKGARRPGIQLGGGRGRPP